MKRLSERRKIDILRTLRKRLYKKASRSKVLYKRANIQREENRRLSNYRANFSAKYNVGLPRDPRRYPIMLPDNISLIENYEETVGSINRIRNLSISYRLPIMLYFDNVRSMDPAAILLLAAEIYRCRAFRRYSGGKIITGNYPDDTNIYNQLKELGFFRLLEIEDINKSKSASTEGRPYYLRFITETKVVSEVASTFCDVVTAGAFAMDDTAKRRMVGALKEAMGNSVEHAYVGADPSISMRGRWWVSAYIDPAKREMKVIVFDQGVGIPNTLDPTWPERFAALRSLQWNPTDANMIMAATELFRSSTGQSGRGKGFRDMKRFVDQCDDGELLVLSNSGRYHYVNGVEQIHDHVASINGTLIEWRVRHGTRLEAEGDEDDLGRS